jgi:hypothetical protein
MTKTKEKPTEESAEVAKRQFYFPTKGVSIEAETKAEAIEIMNNTKKDNEVGDDES